MRSDSSFNSRCTPVETDAGAAASIFKFARLWPIENAGGMMTCEAPMARVTHRINEPAAGRGRGKTDAAEGRCVLPPRRVLDQDQCSRPPLALMVAQKEARQC